MPRWPSPPGGGPGIPFESRVNSPVAPPSIPATFDTSPRGLMRLYYRLVLGTGAGILAVHTILGLLNQRPGPAGAGRRGT